MRRSPESARHATVGRVTIALLVVDVHLGPEDEAHWGRRNNPVCEANVAALVAAWREAGEPVVFVRHDWSEPGSPLRPGQPGNDFKPVLTGDPTSS